ncbi:MAG: hypothetical protein Q8L74_16485 [Nitrospirota bacterium]|nr:hypothetical protein [Nitrospirota bacterium]MDP2382384.1 hypothetical protein [Nitrospirota bacterium]MDP3597658.1 hypothetical protein [Nitrospirota bacterium]
MNLLTFRLLCGLAGSLCLFAGMAVTQSHAGDVTVAVMQGKVIALPSSGTGMEESLGLNETVIVTEARGHTAFAQTSNRLLGFSSALRRWTDVPLDSGEQVGRHHVLPRLILAQSDRRVYGFQEGRGHWTAEPLGVRETVKQLHGRGHVAVAITSERAMAFSAYTGGIFSIPWSTDEQVLSVEDSHDACMVRTSTRMLVFRSQSTEWMEVK